MSRGMVSLGLWWCVFSLSASQAAELGFVSSRNSVPRTYVVNLDGSGLTSLEVPEGQAPPPGAPADWEALRKLPQAFSQKSVSPDGQRTVSAEKCTNGYTRLWITDANSRRALTSEGYFDNCPVWSPDGQRIVFSTSRTAKWNLYAINADGSDLRRIPSRFRFRGSPAFSPDGNWLAYTGEEGGMEEGHRLCVSRLDGSEERELPGIPVAPQSIAWALDGQRLVFTCQSYGSDLFAVRDDGTGLRQITDTPVSEGEFDWSPDGQRLVVTQDRGSPCSWLTVFGADGTRQRGVTGMGCFASFPRWLPDGESILFASFCGGPSGLCLSKASGECTYIAKMPEEPTEVERFTLSPDVQRAAYVTGWSDKPGRLYVIALTGGEPKLLSEQITYPHSAPSFSPDGLRLVYVGTVDKNQDLYTIGIDGQDQRRLTTGADQDSDPAWSPDGKRIAFVTGPERARRVALMDSDGSNVRFVEAPPARSCGGLAWSSDSRQMAFAAGPERETRVYIADSQTLSCRRVTNGPGSDYSPRWRPEPLR